MNKEEIAVLAQKQREFFAKHETLDVKYRIKMLKALKNAIKAEESAICEAIRADLGKSHMESYMCEIGMVHDELNYMIKHCKRLSKNERVRTPMTNFAARSFVKKTPYGVVLIMSPWNYPFLLTMGPLVDAIAAGNTAIIKPSAYSPHTSKIIKEIIAMVFAEEYAAVVEGGREENGYLLDEKFDYIFFTGGKTVGKLVMQKASEHLTPITLELGGKSPCIVDRSANIALSAKRIVFGKFLNLGQTCVAPDYILCENCVKEQLIRDIQAEIKKQFGESPLENPNYGKLISKKHFDKIISLIDEEKVIFGGEYNAEELKIAPTIMDKVTSDDKIMQEEIFGPVLPIIGFDDIAWVEKYINSNPKPLAFYIFSSYKGNIDRLLSNCSFGGGCINDTIMHLTTTHMGFGGVGESGMGSYHGKNGFDTFTHKKSILDKKTFIDMPMRYQPYNKKKEKMVKLFMK